jgi:hypothetical protein
LTDPSGVSKHFRYRERLNWENKIEKMNNLLLLWTKRNLTILGKILIIKALIVPIFKIYP